MISPDLYESSVEEELFMVSLPTAEVANNHRKHTNNKSKGKYSKLYIYKIVCLGCLHQ